MITLRFDPKRRPHAKSSASSQTPSGELPPYSQRLGDKLQRLAWHSPPHLAVVELFVDLILERLEDAEL